LAFTNPVIISRDRLLIDGYARCELAKRQGRSTLLCLVYDVSEDHALHLLIETHRRSQGLNDFRRVELALDLEERFKDEASFNRREGGRLKGLSTLTEAEKVDSRKKVARLAHVSVGNVHKVKYILAKSCGALIEVARSGEISINLAEKWSHAPEAKQRENLRQYRIMRGIRKKARTLVAAQTSHIPNSKSEAQVTSLTEFLSFVNHLNATAFEQASQLASVEVQFVKELGRSHTCAGRTILRVCVAWWHQQMISQHPLRQILIQSRAFWDSERIPVNVRENFRKMVDCGTIALGAEVYASATESKLVFHRCKSRFCTSCGQRASEAWQEEMEAILPDGQYVGITFTMPAQFRAIFQQNRQLLHDIPAMGAAAITEWAKAGYGVRLLIVVVQQTFGGFLNFVPHLHIMVSAGGLHCASNRWISSIRFDKAELMRAWRFALIAYLSEAMKKNVLHCDLSSEQIRLLLATQYEREWNIFLSRAGSKAYWLKHDGRYIRRPPVAQHRMKRIGSNQVEYLVKDTRNKQFVSKRYTNEVFLDLLVQHVPDRGRHAMRYFDLLSPRAKARLWSGIFVLLGQRQRERPRRRSWRLLLVKTFGVDPLRDRKGELMHWAGRRAPVPPLLHKL